MGRPSEFNQETADRIVAGLVEGRSMRQICADEDTPDRGTVARWMAERQDFAATIARARELQADYMDDLILETANNCNSDTAAADRVRIAAYQWRASKLKSKVYGDKMQIGGDADNPLTVTVQRLTLKAV